MQSPPGTGTGSQVWACEAQRPGPTPGLTHMVGLVHPGASADVCQVCLQHDLLHQGQGQREASQTDQRHQQAEGSFSRAGDCMRKQQCVLSVRKVFLQLKYLSAPIRVQG